VIFRHSFNSAFIAGNFKAIAMGKQGLTVEKDIL